MLNLSNFMDIEKEQNNTNIMCQQHFSATDGNFTLSLEKSILSSNFILFYIANY